jgi:histidine ammonia-lyase
MGEQLMTIALNGSNLTVTQVVAVSRHGEAVALAPGAIAAMRQSRAVVEEVLNGGKPVYGLTTGVGERKSFLLDPAGRQRFNHRLVQNHRIAQGDVAPADVVRGAMLCLANSYAKGVTGVRPELYEMIITLLNEGFAPPVRRLGSIGQGDLGPMADLAHGLISRSGFEVAENEGLALVSSNAFTTAWACIATADADRLLDVFDVAGALDLEAFGANLTCLHPVIEQTRPFPGLAITVEARTLAHPVSYELASSVKGEGIEDRATMAPLSARRLADMVQLCARVAAIEFVVAAQAIDLRAPAPLGLGTGRAYGMIRELVPFTQADGTLPADLEPLVDLVTRGDLAPAA